MNKKLVSRILLLVVMISVLTLFTGCAFSSSNIHLGVSQLGGSVRMVFDSLVKGLVDVIVGTFQGIWEFFTGIFNILIGAVAWVVEAIAGLF